MKRRWLLDKLEVVKPAIGSGDLIPALSHVLFDGRNLTAFNDLIAIQVPLESDFKGALPGGLLYDLLTASSADEVTVTKMQNEEAVEVKAGPDTLFKLGFRPPEDLTRLFTMPNRPVHPIDVDMRRSLFDALSYCKLSTGSDNSRPEHLGLTAIPNGASCSIYSTSGPTLSRSQIPASPAIPHRALLSKEFCEALFKLIKDTHTHDEESHRRAVEFTQEGQPRPEFVATPIKLGIHDHSRAVVGDTVLFGRLIEARAPLDFDGVFRQHIPNVNGFIGIPSLMWKAVERAVIITNSKVDKPKSQVSFENGELKFFSNSPDRGTVRDTVVDVVNGEEYALEHPDVSVRVDSRLIRAGDGMFDQMRISSDCFMLLKGEHSYLIAAASR